MVCSVEWLAVTLGSAGKSKLVGRLAGRSSRFLLSGATEFIHQHEPLAFLFAQVVGNVEPGFPKVGDLLQAGLILVARRPKLTQTISTQALPAVDGGQCARALAARFAFASTGFILIHSYTVPFFVGRPPPHWHFAYRLELPVACENLEVSIWGICPMARSRISLGKSPYYEASISCYWCAPAYFCVVYCAECSECAGGAIWPRRGKNRPVRRQYASYSCPWMRRRFASSRLAS